MFSLSVFVALAAPAPAAVPAPAQPAAPTETVTTKKVCKEIEVPMSRMLRRVCQTVTVKKPVKPDAAETPAVPAAPSGN